MQSDAASNLGLQAGAEVCGDLLEDYAAELADVIRANTQRVLAENFAVTAGSGVATAGGGGALPHEVVATLSSVLPRAVRAFATSALIGPWVEARLDGPVDKAEFVMFYDDACMYGTFRLNFHRFDRFELDLRGYTQP